MITADTEARAMAIEENKREQTQAALKAAYRATFAGPLAQEVLRDLVDEGALFRENSYATDPACLNPMAAGVFEGRRRILLRIVSMADLDLAAILALAKFNRPGAPATPQPRPAKTENNGAMQ